MTDLPASEPPTSVEKPGRRRWLLAGLAAVGLLVVAGAVAWFEPHKLFVDDRVDEALPVVVATGGEPPAPTESSPAEPPVPGAAAPGSTAEPSAPVALAEGNFSSIDHDTSGRALILDVGGDGRVVRLEDLATDNGPDLFVYLSAAPVSAGEAALDDDVVDLGRLKGNQGDQNYEVPAGVDLERYKTVVIWCRRFGSGFGAADLS